MSELFYRTIELERKAVDKEKRSAAVTFSTETPVSRWFGQEILLHGEKNVDLVRLRSIGAVLMNHNPDRILGSVHEARIENNVGRATIRFDDDDDGNRAMAKVISGSLRGLSVGYRVKQFREVRRDEEWTDKESGRTFKGPVMIATRWEPHEISLTPIPADAKSQVGRDLSRSLDGINIERSHQTKEQDNMEKAEVQAMIDAAIRGLTIPKTEDIVTAVRTALKEDAKPKFSMPIERAQELSSQAAAVSTECQNEVRGMIIDRKTEIECVKRINEILLGRTDGDKNKSGDGGNFTGKRQAVDFEKVDDDDFARMIKNIEDFQVE